MRKWITLLMLSLCCLTVSSIRPIQAQEPMTCPGFIKSRLVVGQIGRVTPGDANNVRSEPSRQAASVGSIPGEGVFTVLDGPVCADNLAWWQVDYNGLVGWTVEGADGVYWLEPYEECQSAFSIGDEVEVLDEYTGDIYAEPSNSGAALIHLEEGSLITITDGPMCDNQRSTWIKITADEVEGWIRESSYPSCDSYCFGPSPAVQHLRYPLKSLIPIERTEAINRVEAGRMLISLSSSAISAENVNGFHNLMQIGDGLITGFTWSPNGGQLAVIGSVDVRIYDPGSLNALPHIISTHEVRPSKILYSPDSQTLVTADIQGDVYFWDSQTFEQQTTLQRNSGITALMFNYDGSILAIGTDHDVTIWSLSPRDEPTLIHTFSMGADVLEFIKNSNRFVAQYDDELAILDGDNGAILKLESTFGKEPGAGLIDWEITLDGDNLSAIGSNVLGNDFAPAYSYYVLTWELNTGERGFSSWSLGDSNQKDFSYLSLEVNPVTGDQLYNFGDDQLILFGQQDTSWPLEVGDVTATAYSPRGDRFALGTQAGGIYLFDSARADFINVLHGINGQVRSISFTADGKFLAARGDDNSVRIWEVESFKRLGTIQLTKLAPPFAVSPDGTQVYSASEIWDITTGQRIEKLENPEGRGYENVFYQPDGTLIGRLYQSDGTYAFQDVRSGETYYSHDSSGSRGIYSLDYTYDARIRGNGTSTSVIITELITGQEVQRMEGYFDDPWPLAFTNNNRLIVIADNDGDGSDKPTNLTLWDVSSGELLFNTALEMSHLSEALFSPDGTAIIWHERREEDKDESTIMQTWITYLDLTTHEFRETGPLDYLLNDIVFNADGSLIVGSDTNGHLRLITVDTGQDVIDVEAHLAGIQWFGFSADGTRLYSFGREGVFKAWGVE